MLSSVHESELNLDIALRMVALSCLTGIKYTMTRDSDDISYPDSAKSVSSRKKYDQKRRVEHINNTANTVLISVHQNCYLHNPTVLNHFTRNPRAVIRLQSLFRSQ